jgi:hypothetical protein
LGRNEKKKQVHSTPLKYASLRMTVFGVGKSRANFVWLLADYCAVLHYEAYMFAGRDIFKWVAGDGYDVGEVSGF